MIGQTISTTTASSKSWAATASASCKAEDLELGRFVAIKLLPESLSEDSQALDDFDARAPAPRPR